MRFSWDIDPPSATIGLGFWFRFRLQTPSRCESTTIDTHDICLKTDIPYSHCCLFSRLSMQCSDPSADRSTFRPRNRPPGFSPRLPGADSHSPEYCGPLPARDIGTILKVESRGIAPSLPSGVPAPRFPRLPTILPTVGQSPPPPPGFHLLGTKMCILIIFGRVCKEVCAI